jgi:hypothetical protein
MEERWPAVMEDQKEPLLQPPTVLKPGVMQPAITTREEKDGGMLRALVFGGINGLGKQCGFHFCGDRIQCSVRCLD